MNNKNSGFTLIEMIITMAILAVVAIGVGGFIQIPMNGYIQVNKRSELVDSADTSLRRMKREIQASLPNSIRVSSNAGKIYLEFLLVESAGRYRADYSDTGSGDILDFTVNDTSFDVLSGGIDFSGGEKVVVYNLGILGYDAYAADNLSEYIGAIGIGLTSIQINAKKFPLTSPNGRFYVVETPVTYVCDLSAKKITRHDGYIIQQLQPNDNLASPLSTSNKGVVTNNVSNCTIDYMQGVNSRNGIVSLFIELSDGAEKISLYGDTYVPNI